MAPIAPQLRNPAFRAYGIYGQKYMDITNDIKRYGGKLDLDHPIIVAIGNESSGKTSQIEGMCDIQLPRGDGTCTRCPMEVRLRQSLSPWSCQIYLRFDEDRDFHDADDLVELPFGARLEECHRSELATRVLRAQHAALSSAIYRSTPEIFLDCDEDRLPMSTSFSKNVVVIEICGPDSPNLDLIDLPGIISVDKESSKSIKLIKELVSSYIERKNCLILVAITMRDNWNNQAAITMAKEVDPSSERTIPVLTKPDTLEDGQEDIWVRRVMNEDIYMPLGYYVTRQPNLRERQNGITRSEAAENERTFFEKTSPWSTLPETFRARLGTANLTEGLSDLLCEHIQRTLPETQRRVNAMLQVTIAKQKEMSEPPREPIRDVAQLCDQFGEEIGRYTRADTDHESLVQACGAVYDTFGRNLERTRLRFSPKIPADAAADDEAAESDDGSYSASLSSSPSKSIPKSRDQLLAQTQFDVCDVREIIQLCRGRDLSFDTPDNAKKILRARGVACWSDLAESTFKAIHPIHIELVDGLIGKFFCRYQHTSLLGRVRDIVSDQFRTLSEKTISALEGIQKLEKLPFTQNEQALYEARDRHYYELKKELVEEASSRLSNFATTEVNNAITALAKYGFAIESHIHLSRLCAAGKFEKELNIMAEVSAYFDVAYRRFVDNVPLVIDTNFTQPAAEAIRNALLKELKIYDKVDGARLCTEYLSEKPAVAAERKRLETQRTQLERIKGLLATFNSKVPVDLTDNMPVSGDDARSTQTSTPDLGRSGMPGGLGSTSMSVASIFGYH